jgi:hypothetical protein
MRMLSPRPELRPSAAELLALPLLSQHKHEEVRSPPINTCAGGYDYLL